MKKDKDKSVINNLVHKHAFDFNKSAVFRDRKKDKKKGYNKHKNKEE